MFTTSKSLERNREYKEGETIESLYSYGYKVRKGKNITGMQSYKEILNMVLKKENMYSEN
jgi:hypothetical protein